MSYLSSLKCLRIFRVFFMNNKWDYFQILFEALGNCLLPTLSFAVVYVRIDYQWKITLNYWKSIFIYVFSIIGMNLFAGKITNAGFSRSNFDSLLWAFFTVYQIISLEQWQIVFIFLKEKIHLYYRSIIYAWKMSIDLLSIVISFHLFSSVISCWKTCFWLGFWAFFKWLALIW